jgi:hypothetical protein
VAFGVPLVVVGAAAGLRLAFPVRPNALAAAAPRVRTTAVRTTDQCRRRRFHGVGTGVLY